MDTSYKKYILSDYYRYWGRVDCFLAVTLKAFFCLNGAFSLQFWFRNASLRSGIFARFSQFMYARLCRQKQIYIPLDVEIGYGLYLGHCMCIVISSGTKIGNNCNLSQFLNIGSNNGHSAIIGDNVYIGPHVCLVEGVKIGSNSTIGAGAVVTKDVPFNATVVGVPARVLSYNNPGRFIHNIWK